MPFTTLKPSGIDLSQTFAFTGSVTGAGGGKLLKLQQYDVSTAIHTASSSFSTFKTCSFTPTSSSSTLYFFFDYNYQLYGNNSTTNADGKLNITSEATGSDVVIVQQAFTTVSHGNSNTHYEEMTGSMSGTQASQGTSAFNINLRTAVRSTGRMRIYESGGDFDKPCHLTVMEIGA